MRLKLNIKLHARRLFQFKLINDGVLNNKKIRPFLQHINVTFPIQGSGRMSWISSRNDFKYHVLVEPLPVKNRSI
jgi:hypothetical protein